MDPMVFEKARLALKDEDPQARAGALRELASYDDVGAIRMILSHARNENRKEVLRLIGTMVQKHDAGRFVDFLRAQLEAGNEQEKCRILYVMKFMNSQSVLELAAEQFGGTDDRVIQAAFQVIQPLDGKKKLNILAGLALADDSDKRCRAMRALSKFANSAVIPYIKRALSDPEFAVKQAAYEGLLNLKAAGLAEAVALLDQTEAPVPPDRPDDHQTAPETPVGKGRQRITPLERQKNEGKLCRTCKYGRKDRPDGKKMAMLRMWCSNLKKETLPDRTCLRGSW